MRKFRFSFESYGVVITLESVSSELLAVAREIAKRTLLGNLVFRDEEAQPDNENTVEICEDDDGNRFLVSDGTESVRVDHQIFEQILNSKIRILIAEKAYPWVFIHAGVVEWKGLAIVLPAFSYQGKTTLVSELIKAGARYMSDEYAVLGENGLVYPFARDLSVRMIQGEPPVLKDPVEFGASIQPEPIKPGLVVLTKYEQGAEWNPAILSQGQGMLEIIPQVISINYNTKFALKVLNTTFNRAIIVRTLRSEAPEAARFILNFFDNNLDLDRER